VVRIKGKLGKGGKGDVLTSGTSKSTLQAAAATCTGRGGGFKARNNGGAMRSGRQVVQRQELHVEGRFASMTDRNG